MSYGLNFRISYYKNVWIKGEIMKLDFSNFLYAMSYALDAAEK